MVQIIASWFCTYTHVYNFWIELPNLYPSNGSPISYCGSKASAHPGCGAGGGLLVVVDARAVVVEGMGAIVVVVVGGKDSVDGTAIAVVVSSALNTKVGGSVMIVVFLFRF